MKLNPSWNLAHFSKPNSVTKSLVSCVIVLIIWSNALFLFQDSHHLIEIFSIYSVSRLLPFLHILYFQQSNHTESCQRLLRLPASLWWLLVAFHLAFLSWRRPYPLSNFVTNLFLQVVSSPTKWVSIIAQHTWSLAFLLALFPQLKCPSCGILVVYICLGTAQESGSFMRLL